MDYLRNVRHIVHGGRVADLAEVDQSPKLWVEYGPSGAGRTLLHRLIVDSLEMMMSTHMQKHLRMNVQLCESVESSGRQWRCCGTATCAREVRCPAKVEDEYRATTTHEKPTWNMYNIHEIALRLFVKPFIEAKCPSPCPRSVRQRSSILLWSAL